MHNTHNKALASCIECIKKFLVHISLPVLRPDGAVDKSRKTGTVTTDSGIHISSRAVECTGWSENLGRVIHAQKWQCLLHPLIFSPLFGMQNEPAKSPARVIK